MGPLDVFWHVSNLFVPAIGLGLLAATMTKWLWRKELRSLAWHRLAAPACAACAAVALLALVLLGRDGRMAMYAAMVVACALTLWWQGFGPGRKR